VIPRYQRVLFWCLNGAILVMALVLLRGCAQTREKLTRERDKTPLAAPVATPSEQVHLALADDATGTISLAVRDVALPVEATARTRVLLGRLLAEYSYKGSTHRLESGPAVDDVFLLDLPLRPAAASPGAPGARAGAKAAGQEQALDAVSGEDAAGVPHAPGGQMAVVNLRGTFADHHPSGIEAETLTIDSILGTIYANFPKIEQVRFLVDGQPRETLNGHADLMKTYAVRDTTSKEGGL
jgi:hypothetical protein